MRSSNELIVDFVARGDTDREWKLVLVEEGPWEELESEMRRLQDRLYNCLEAAVDGLVAEQFPDTIGSAIVIQLDGYNLPDDTVSAFWQKFSSQVLNVPDFAQALASSDFVSDIKFELNLGTTS